MSRALRKTAAAPVAVRMRVPSGLLGSGVARAGRRLGRLAQTVAGGKSPAGGRRCQAAAAAGWVSSGVPHAVQSAGPGGKSESQKGQ